MIPRYINDAKKVQHSVNHTRQIMIPLKILFLSNYLEPLILSSENLFERRAACCDTYIAQSIICDFRDRERTKHLCARMIRSFDNFEFSLIRFQDVVQYCNNDNPKRSPTFYDKNEILPINVCNKRRVFDGLI